MSTAPELYWIVTFTKDGNTCFKANSRDGGAWHVESKLIRDLARWHTYRFKDGVSECTPEDHFGSADIAKAWCQSKEDEEWEKAHPPREMTADEVLAAIRKYDIGYTEDDDLDDGDPRKWNAYGDGPDDDQFIDVYAATPAQAIAKFVREAEGVRGGEVCAGMGSSTVAPDNGSPKAMSADEILDAIDRLELTFHAANNKHSSQRFVCYPKDGPGYVYGNGIRDCIERVVRGMGSNPHSPPMTLVEIDAAIKDYGLFIRGCSDDSESTGISWNVWLGENHLIADIRDNDLSTAVRECIRKITAARQPKGGAA